MSSLKKHRFICFDVESTGLDIENDQIIEFAAVTFNEMETFDSFETLIDPGRAISPESMAIHHITDEMVKGKPTIEKVLPKIIEMIGDHIVVGHGILFDIEMIENAAKKIPIRWSLPRERIIDTLRLARLYGESPTNSLEVLRQHFNIEEMGAHRAMNDVMVNIAVFKQLTKKFTSVHQLLERLKSPILMKQMPLGKYKGQNFSGLPHPYLMWAKKQKFDRDLLFSIESELKKRKKRLGFQQSNRPFENLAFS